MAESEDLAIGIDLGTTYSCVAVWWRGRAEVIPNEQGNRTTPSCVAFTDQGRLFGDAANNQAALNPTNTVFDAKRLIGRRFTDPLVQRDMKLWPFKVVADGNDNPKIEVKYKDEIKEFAPEEISAMVVTKMKEIAEAYLETTVNNAVITVPAYFSDSQRRATRDAGVIAGLNVLRVINEPMAAAIAYGFDQEAIRYGKKDVLVFDLGGGTFDVCIITLDVDAFSVKSVAGHNHLGGEDFDDMMVNHFIEVLKKKYKKDISSNPRAIRRVRTECEKAKRNLSTAAMTSIEIDALVDGMDFQYTMSREEFENHNKFLFKMCIECVEKCIRDAKMEKSNIDEVVLVGGSTRIPYVQKMLENIFNGKKLCKTLNPDEAVAFGAAIYAALLTNNDIQKMQIPVKLSEVTPLSLGINLIDDSMSVLIPRNTTIPTKVERIFLTSIDNQQSVLIQVLEGDEIRSKDNDILGKFELSGIPPAPKGSSQITVCFEIDANGILNVTAKDIKSGLENKITITKDRKKLSSDKIANIVQQAENFKKDEEEYRRQMNAENTLDKLIYELGNIIKDEKISMKGKRMIEDAIARTIEWKKRNKQAKASEYNIEVEKLQRHCEQIKCHCSIGAIDESTSSAAFGHSSREETNDVSGTALRMVSENDH